MFGQDDNATVHTHRLEQAVHTTAKVVTICVRVIGYHIIGSEWCAISMKSIKSDILLEYPLPPASKSATRSEACHWLYW
eukprot:m.163664 g.163664  ORF g.163664 m.163664 type:complete len:79 (-) comp18108_c0_seq1:1286-1522(-)